MDVFGDEFVLHVEDVLSHDICVDDAREAGRDPFDIPLHGSALPGGLEDYLAFVTAYKYSLGTTAHRLGCKRHIRLDELG